MTSFFLTQLDPIILASASTARKALLDDVGIQTIVIPFDGDEATEGPLDALGRAQKKARAVSHEHRDHWVIGADQICHLNGTVFHQPKTVSNAIAALMQLQGATHELMTSVALFKGGACVWHDTHTVSLTMKPLSLATITHYVYTDRPLNSCGAYRFESMGIHLFESVSHDKATIQGLPIVALVNALHEVGVVSI